MKNPWTSGYQMIINQVKPNLSIQGEHRDFEQISINQSINQSINPADVSPILEVILTYDIVEAHCYFVDIGRIVIDSATYLLTINSPDILTYGIQVKWHLENVI